MQNLNYKETELLTQWVKSGDTRCKIMSKETPGANYNFGGTYFYLNTELECLEYEAMIDNFRQNGFIRLESRNKAFTNYTLTQKAVEYVNELS